ncbi:MAG: hypothetical protein IT338_08100 [Thermomicrobiales bacterium]|nr:hypothetical protein [Thermomicrobiales bacterium]
MNRSLGTTHPHPEGVTAGNLRFLQVMLALQVILGLLWGISMLFFAQAIAMGNTSGEHIEKIALEGAAHMMLVFGAILVWRDPYGSRSALLMMIFLNALWTLTDLVYVPLLGLTATDFPAKIIVNAILAIGLAWSGRRAGVI